MLSRECIYVLLGFGIFLSAIHSLETNCVVEKNGIISKCSTWSLYGEKISTGTYRVYIGHVNTEKRKPLIGLSIINEDEDTYSN